MGDIDVEGDIGTIKVKGDINADINANSINYIRAYLVDGSTIRSDTSIDKIRARNGQDVSISAGTTIERVKFSQNLNQSTIAAGADLGRVYVTGDAIDNLILAGADLGSDSQLDRVDDSFSNGNIDLISVRGSYWGTVTAAAVNPGADLTYFTDDDAPGSEGGIYRVKFGRTSLTKITSEKMFGLLASKTISPFRVNGQLFEAPVEMGMFRMLTMG